jgi:hypothetical protein
MRPQGTERRCAIRAGPLQGTRRPSRSPARPRGGALREHPRPRIRCDHPSTVNTATVSLRLSPGCSNAEHPTRPTLRRVRRPPHITVHRCQSGRQPRPERLQAWPGTQLAHRIDIGACRHPHPGLTIRPRRDRRTQCAFDPVTAERAIRRTAANASASTTHSTTISRTPRCALRTIE